MNHKPLTIEDVFDDAVSRLQAGASKDEIMALYPEHKAELEQMLGVVMMLEDVKLSEVPSEELRAAFSAHDMLNESESRSRTFALLDMLFRPSVRMPAAILAVLIIAVLAVNQASAPAPSRPFDVTGSEVAQNTTGETPSISAAESAPASTGIGGSVVAVAEAPAAGATTAMKVAPATFNASAFDTSSIAATESVLVFPQFESFVADEIALSAFEQELMQ